MVNGATDIAFYIQHGKEERYLEYKGSMVWTSDDTKVKIAQAMMAMSNLRNGGVIVVGMKEPQRGVWEPDIMTDEQVASFTQDDLAQWVNDYAVPAVQFTVEPFVLDTNKFVIINVREFDSFPTICRKPKPLRGKEVLKKGAIYYTYKIKFSDLKIIFKKKSNVWLIINFVDTIPTGIILFLLFIVLVYVCNQ